MFAFLSVDVVIEESQIYSFVILRFGTMVLYVLFTMLHSILNNNNKQ